MSGVEWRGLVMLMVRIGRVVGCLRMQMGCGEHMVRKWGTCSCWHEGVR